MAGAFQSNAFQNDAFQVGATGSGTAGALSWAEANDTCSASGTVTNRLAVAWTEADDVTSIAGSVLGLTTAALAWTEADDSASIYGSVLVPASGVIAWSEQDDETQISASTTASGRVGGFEMVSMEPTWKRAIRQRAERTAKVELGRKQRKRAEMIEKLAAKEALSAKPDQHIESRISSLLSEWVALAPKLDLMPVEEVPPDDAYQAFMARVAQHMRRIEDEDDEHAAEMLLLM